MSKRMVAVGESGNRIGQDHPRAKLTDRDVELVRQLHEEGMTYKAIAEKLEISHFHVGRLCRYEKRVLAAVGFRAVKTADKQQD